MVKVGLAILILLPFLAVHASGAPASTSEGTRGLTVDMAPLGSEPVIDGDLADAAWQTASLINELYQFTGSGNVPAELATEVRMGYHDGHLYVAFRAWDKRGAKDIRALATQRDAIGGDDRVTIILDTLNQRRDAYVFSFNPLGIVADATLSGDLGEDTSFNIPIRSVGSLTGDGYVIEAAIPLDKLKTKPWPYMRWGINVTRNVKRLNDRLYSWVPLSADGSWHLSVVGQLTGTSQRQHVPSIDVRSTVSFSQDQLRVRTDPTVPGVTRVDPQGIRVKPGVSAMVKFSPRTELKVDVRPGYLAGTEVFRPSSYFQRKRASLDPDFGIRRTKAIRGFALDGTYLDSLSRFATPLDVVSKYALVDPDYVVEFSAGAGLNEISFLSARDPSPGRFTVQELEHPQIRRSYESYVGRDAYLNAFRLKRPMGRDSTLGFLATTYRFAGTGSDSVGVDGQVQLSGSTKLAFQAVGVTSQRPFFDADGGKDIVRKGRGFGYFATLETKRKGLHLLLASEGRSNDYRADLGFTRRFNLNRHSAFARYRPESQVESTGLKWHLSGLSDIAYDWQGRLRSWGTDAKLNLAFPRETYVSIGYGTGFERVFEEDFGRRRFSDRQGAFVGSPERSTRHRTFSFYGESSITSRLFASAAATYKQGEIDLDYDAGPRFLRVSPLALDDPDAPLDPHPGGLFYLETSLAYQTTDTLRISLDYSKYRLTRYDNGRVAFDDNTFAGRVNYRLSKAAGIRAILDYSSLTLRLRSQLMFALTHPTGRSLYVVYSDDHARAGYGPFFGSLAPDFRTNGRTFLIRVVYPVFSKNGARIP